MQHERAVWLDQIKAVEREHLATRLAVDRLLKEGSDNPTLFQASLAYRDLPRASDQLEATFIIRLYAEAEAGLRRFWKTYRTSEPPARDLLDGIAASRDIPSEYLHFAHLVRTYRNSLVHAADESVQTFNIAEVRGHLCRYFSRLPPSWQ
jgi:hypothetical protein